MKLRAIYDACLVRFRSDLMTEWCAILGILRLPWA